MKKIILPRKEVLPSIQQAHRFISNRPQLPVLTCLHLETRRGELILTATDLRAGIRIKVPSALINEELKIVCPAKLLIEFLQTSSEETFSLEATEKNQIILQSGRNTASLHSFLVDEYPLFPTISGQDFSIPVSKISHLCEQVSFAASLDETRPVLTAILLQIEDSMLKMVSTDGFRLAMSQTQIDNTHEQELLIPARILEEIIKASSNKSGDIKISLSEDGKQALFSTTGLEIVSRLIEGPFPEYQKILPKEFSHALQISTDQFAQVLKTAVLFGRDSSNIVRLDAAEKALKISSQSSTAGTFQGGVPLQHPISEAVSIAFNGKYILELLSKINTDEIIVQLNSSLKPGAFSIPGEEGFLYVVMPFRLNEN